MQTISAVIAVKNEAHQIRDCLEHIKWTDEIIIIDNGSTDDTVKICKEYTKKIYQCTGQKFNSIPKLQNYGADKATKDWIIILDADVIVTKKAKEEILIKIQNPKYAAYYLPHKTVAFGKKLKHALFCNILKLYKKNQARLEENSEHPLTKTKGKIGRIKNVLLHYAHPDIETFVRKVNLYTSRDAKKIIENGHGGLLNKKLKKINILDLVLRPLVYASYLYFIKKYYKDGIYGLIISMLMGQYLFLENAKIMELQKKPVINLPSQNIYKKQ